MRRRGGSRARDFFGFLFEKLRELLSERVSLLVLAAMLLFLVLVVTLFNLRVGTQSVVPAIEAAPAPRTGVVTRPVLGPRGHIYDRHGRPLAVNISSFALMMDPAVAITNEALLKLAHLLEAGNERYVDSFPISRERPFEFTFSGTTEDAIRRQEHRWKDDMAIPNPWEATAEESWEFLIHQWGICTELCEEDIRRIMNFRAKIFVQRLLDLENYTPTPVVFAYDVSNFTIAAVEEQNHIFSGLFTSMVTLRYYPYGRYAANMIGYLLPITREQLNANEHLGYTAFDLFGRAGLELSMERFLRGSFGQETFTVNAAGRRITEAGWLSEPAPGNNVFLSIDIELQRAVFHIIEGYLSDALIARLSLPQEHDDFVPISHALASFVKGSQLNMRGILESVEGELQFPIKQYVLARLPNADTSRVQVLRANTLVANGLLAGRITPDMMLLALIGTGHITDTDGKLQSLLLENPEHALYVLVQAIKTRQMTPAQINIDPSTASAVVSCTRTGEVLAAVAYPSFDNNRLVNDFDNDYFHMISVLDPTFPMINRPFTEARAPGSTFKMFTAAAALEGGAIEPDTLIFDGVRFTSAGEPFINCWSSAGHGSLNVTTAIAVSCNFFFAEAAHRLGNAGNGGTLRGIEVFNSYMEFFGLNEPTGVQVGERNFEFIRAGFFGNTMASPEFKRFVWLSQNPNADEESLQWHDRDTAQVSIGQGYNAYTAAQMARGMGIIATRGKRLPFTVVSRIESFGGEVVMMHEAAHVSTGVTISDSTWDAIIEGMRLVVEPGANGTAVDVFSGVKLSVAGKTGTAEQIADRLSHHSFGAFAPIENPEIAVYVNVPFGSTSAFPQIAAFIARDIIQEFFGDD